jgi:diaminohydroxyphosphoribosylaminopyrimidine deaminase/5-amino-6-(5-phosphoribosylamino)uracil reductase
MDDAKYMQRALDLATKGLGAVSPNPLVGCVIVHEDKIIGEGWHKVFGGPHAEVNAIHHVSDKSLLSSATAYVTLEPCSYHGKTPACTNLLIEHHIKTVVIAAIDPNPKVSGKGIKLLKEAGVEVTVGILEKEAMLLNRRFIINMQQQRPYIILKWAQTADGFIARENFDSKWISNQTSRQLVHKWRSEEDAILVGKNTVIHDNPSLTVRDWQGRNPVRIILDRQAGLEGPYHIFNAEAETLVFNCRKSQKNEFAEWIAIDASDFLQQMLQTLFERGIGSLIIEGGSKVLSSFILAGLWDEARIFTSDKEFGVGIRAPQIQGALIEEQNIDNDSLQIFRKS